MHIQSNCLSTLAHSTLGVARLASFLLESFLPSAFLIQHSSSLIYSLRFPSKELCFCRARHLFSAFPLSSARLLDLSHRSSPSPLSDIASIEQIALLPHRYCKNRRGGQISVHGHLECSLLPWILLHCKTNRQLKKGGGRRSSCWSSLCRSCSCNPRLPSLFPFGRFFSQNR